MYAGIFGPSQGLDILLDAANYLRRESPDLARRIRFVLVGAGVERPRLEARRRQEELEDLVTFLPEQPRQRIPSLLRAAGAIAVTLRARRDTHTVPSKIYESIASGRPVLVSANGAPGDILRASGAGFASSAGDVEGFAAGILQLAQSPELARSLGEKGRAYAARFDRRQLVKRFESLLEDVALRSRR
jgi:glycosyltransferase involved in cell wall biosynthesis